jgi:hypothetical protein
MDVVCDEASVSGVFGLPALKPHDSCIS